MPLHHLHQGCAVLAELQAKRDEVAELCRRHGVRRLSVFGSAARADFDPIRSDIDVLVEFKPVCMPSLAGLVSLQDELSRLLGGRHVDVATPTVLENSYRRRSIEPDLEVLYAA